VGKAKARPSTQRNRGNRGIEVRLQVTGHPPRQAFAAEIKHSENQKQSQKQTNVTKSRRKTKQKPQPMRVAVSAESNG
jgi:hypothetical protein